jgi:hypothetical protein
MYSHKLAVRWQDEKPVTILTTMHDNNSMMDQETQAGKQGTSPETKACPSVITNIWGDGQNGPATYILPSHMLLSEGIQEDLHLFDMMLFNVYVLYKITSQKLNYNQFRLVIPEKLHGLTHNAGICKTRLSRN